jgi:hypothetical protein
LSGESVLVSTSRLEESLRRQISEACEHARVRAVFWSPTGAERSPGPMTPALLVAALPSGQRVIPEDIAALAVQEFQAVPLLLLCGEPLVRHSVSLQGGRVTLLGPPLTREKISARIRTAVAGTDNGHAAVDDRLVQVRELRGREWWAGALARESDLLPTLCKLGRHGVAGVVPLNVHSPVSATSRQDAALALASGLPVERAAAGLEAAIGQGAAAVWFSPATGQWAFYAPRPEVELWLHSPLRLPSFWRFGQEGGDGGPWRMLPAASGDVVLVAAGEPGALIGSEAFKGGDLAPAVEAGGPALLDHLEAVLSAGTAAGSALIVELR